MTDDLQHIGTPRHSGRYPWGSGANPQRSRDILDEIDDFKRQGITDQTEIARQMGITTTKLRTDITWATKKRKDIAMERAVSMRSRGESLSAIGKELGMSSGTVANYLKAANAIPEQQLDNITEALKKSVEEHEYLDVGAGVELQMGISRGKMNSAISKLQEEGYYVHKYYPKRLNDRSKTLTFTVLTKDPDLKNVIANANKIRPVDSWTDDGGLTIKRMQPIQHVGWERLSIKYGDEGGVDKDGIIELRRGVKDLDLVGKNYAQVRIGVGGTHFLKGMAMYSDNLPEGVDILFNTNKPKGTPKEEVLKPLKKSEFNPFGATIKLGRQFGAINMVNEEGDWDKWSDDLSAQFLSKQSPKLIKERLDFTYDDLIKQRAEISSLTNPIVKKHLLEAYSGGLEAKARHLEVQGLPGTKGHVILPFPDMNPAEVYAPNYRDGTRIVLVRYPHGGIFELPELTVNNKQKSAKKIIGMASDALGIHPTVAQKLSGADFDGDTVWAIPNDYKKIKVSRSLDELKEFDPNKYQVGHKTITKEHTQKQMGIVSNLITDMTIKGASQSEIARAVKHSMVVIDAEKHKLDYKQSAIDNGISALQKKYQTHISPLDGQQHGGASTIISRSNKEILADRDMYKRLNPETGGANPNVFGVRAKVAPIHKEQVLNPKTGRMNTITVGGKKVAMMDVFDDAYKLSSGTATENLFADYANKLKALNKSVQQEATSIRSIKKSPAAAAKYAKEVESLNTKLNTALLNAPRERQAQLLASKIYHDNLKLDYDIDKDAKKKLRTQATVVARDKVGAKRTQVVITDLEWEAIQAGAISTHMLDQILSNADMDKVKELAMPRVPQPKLSSARVTRAKILLDKGYTPTQIADQLGVSVSMVKAALYEEG